MVDARTDALKDNFLYVWLPEITLSPSKYPPPYKRGLWVRIPVQFPFANPHGIVTIEPLNPIDGHPLKGHNPNHEMCSPVRNLGGVNYYSWTWSGELGNGPPLRNPEDIIKVIYWIERRIKIA
jgi:hypothetical protein